MYHLSTWSEKCPRAFHKTVKANLGLSPEAIMDKVLKGELARDKPGHNLTLKDFESNNDEALTYVKLLKEEYQKIAEEEAKYSEDIKEIEAKIAQPPGLHHEHKKDKKDKKGKKGKKQKQKKKH